MLQHMLERMRQAREERGLDLDALARRTRIRVHQLEAIEQGYFERLPRGVYARAVVRAYAEAVGLEPNNAVAELGPLLPEPEDAMAGIARVHGYDPPAATRVAAPPPVHGTREAIAPEAPVPPPPPAFDRAAIARAGAAAIDTAVLGGITALLVTLSAGAAGVPVADLLPAAAPALCALTAVITGLYFVLLGGVAGATLGSRVAGLAPVARRAPALDLNTACRRGAAAAARELSIVVELAVPAVAARRAAGTREASRSDTRWEETAPAP
jgi:hypothetical protein